MLPSNLFYGTTIPGAIIFFDLQQAIIDFQEAMQAESEAMQLLNDLLNTLKANNHD